MRLITMIETASNPDQVIEGSQFIVEIEMI